MSTWSECYFCGKQYEETHKCVDADVLVQKLRSAAASREEDIEHYRQHQRDDADTIQTFRDAWNKAEQERDAAVARVEKAEADHLRFIAEHNFGAFQTLRQERDAALAQVARLREALAGLIEEHTDCPSCDACEPAYEALVATNPIETIENPIDATEAKS